VEAENLVSHSTSGCPTSPPKPSTCWSMSCVWRRTGTWLRSSQTRHSWSCGLDVWAPTSPAPWSPRQSPGRPSTGARHSGPRTSSSYGPASAPAEQVEELRSKVDARSQAVQQLQEIGLLAG